MDETNNASVETTTEQTQENAPAENNNPFNFPEGTQAEQTEQTKETAPTVPEKYEFKLPEGLQMTPEIEERFTTLAKQMNLTQEQANGLIDLHSEIMLDAMKQAEVQKNKWAEECQKAGLTTPEKMKAAKLAVDTFDRSGALMREMIESGIAYSPNMQAFLQYIGGILTEDTAHDSKPAAQSKSAADLLFSNSKY